MINPNLQCQKPNACRKTNKRARTCWDCRYPLTKDMEEKIITRVRAGWPYKELATIYGVTNEWIGTLARREGIFRRLSNTKTERTRIKNQYALILEDLQDQRRSYADIAYKWNISVGKLSRIAKASGLSRFYGLRSIDP